MEIEVDRLVLAHEPPTRPDGPTVLAYASLLICGELIIHDVRLIRLADGRLLVAMPDRPLKLPCIHCRKRVGRRWNFCPKCGGELPDFGPVVEDDGREAYFTDVVHPIQESTRIVIESAVKRAHCSAVRAEYEARTAARAERARMREATNGQAAQCVDAEATEPDAAVV